jgi:hypothetical protein
LNKAGIDIQAFLLKRSALEASLFGRIERTAGRPPLEPAKQLRPRHASTRRAWLREIARGYWQIARVTK